MPSIKHKSIAIIGKIYGTELETHKVYQDMTYDEARREFMYDILLIESPSCKTINKEELLCKLGGSVHIRYILTSDGLISVS